MEPLLAVTVLVLAQVAPLPCRHLPPPPTSSPSPDLHFPPAPPPRSRKLRVQHLYEDGQRWSDIPTNKLVEIVPLSNKLAGKRNKLAYILPNSKLVTNKGSKHKNYKPSLPDLERVVYFSSESSADSDQSESTSQQGGEDAITHEISDIVQYFKEHNDGNVDGVSQDAADPGYHLHYIVHKKRDDVSSPHTAHNAHKGHGNKGTKYPIPEEEDSKDDQIGSEQDVELRDESDASDPGNVVEDEDKGVFLSLNDNDVAHDAIHTHHAHGHIHEATTSHPAHNHHLDFDLSKVYTIKSETDHNSESELETPAASAQDVYADSSDDLSELTASASDSSASDSLHSSSFEDTALFQDESASTAEESDVSESSESSSDSTASESDELLTVEDADLNTEAPDTQVDESASSEEDEVAVTRDEPEGRGCLELQAREVKAPNKGSGHKSYKLTFVFSR